MGKQAFFQNPISQESWGLPQDSSRDRALQNVGISQSPKISIFKSLGKKAKSGNLNLFLGILLFSPLVFPCNFQGKKGKIRRKRFRLPDFAFKQACFSKPYFAKPLREAVARRAETRRKNTEQQRTKRAALREEGRPRRAPMQKGKAPAKRRRQLPGRKLKEPAAAEVRKKAAADRARARRRR